MAQERKYLERTVPDASVEDYESSVSLIKMGLSNKRIIDSEYFEDCLNIDVGKLPVICPMKIYSRAGSVSRMWKENEGKTGEELLGEVPIGEHPAITAFGKYIAVGSYISPKDILENEEAWENWFDKTSGADEVTILEEEEAVEIFPEGESCEDDVDIGEEL